jgi:tripartite-type tricarboxylate transporter receptor subunit TctC
MSSSSIRRVSFGVRSLFAAMALLASVPLSAIAQAPAYPSKPVVVTVPFTTGGAADTLARVLSQHLAGKFSQPLVVENRPGAGGTIGMDAVLRQPADAYNVVLVSNSHAASHAIYTSLDYDVRKDFVGIVELADAPVIIAVNPSLGVKTMPELIAYARKYPGKLSYGSCGVGTAHHLAMEVIKSRTKTDIVHVAYRGCTPATLDAVGGQIPLVVASAPAVLPQVKTGKLIAIAVTNPQRSLSMPDVPTIAQSGVPELKNTEVGNWYGLMARKGTPPDRAKLLGDAMAAELRRPEVAEQLQAAGVEVQVASGDHLAELMRTDIDQFSVVVKNLGIKPE